MADRINPSVITPQKDRTIGPSHGTPLPVKPAQRRNSQDDSFEEMRRNFRKLGLRLSGKKLEELLERYRGRGSFLDAFI